jgi:hypothetical protein
VAFIGSIEAARLDLVRHASRRSDRDVSRGTSRDHFQLSVKRLLALVLPYLKSLSYSSLFTGDCPKNGLLRIVWNTRNRRSHQLRHQVRQARDHISRRVRVL